MVLGGGHREGGRVPGARLDGEEGRDLEEVELRSQRAFVKGER
jgi:hypothetical protein